MGTQNAKHNTGIEQEYDQNGKVLRTFNEKKSLVKLKTKKRHCSTNKIKTTTVSSKICTRYFRTQTFQNRSEISKKLFTQKFESFYTLYLMNRLSRGERNKGHLGEFYFTVMKTKTEINRRIFI